MRKLLHSKSLHEHMQSIGKALTSALALRYRLYRRPGEVSFDRFIAPRSGELPWGKSAFAAF